MKTGKKLKWGIMGAGIIARKMADALELSSLNQLYAIASKTPEKARLFANDFKIGVTFIVALGLLNSSAILSKQSLIGRFIALTINLSFFIFEKNNISNISATSRTST